MAVTVTPVEALPSPLPVGEFTHVPDQSEGLEQTNEKVWSSILAEAPKSLLRTMYGVGALAVGTRGPGISKDMLGAFHEAFVNTASSTVGIASAIAAGGLYLYKGVKSLPAEAPQPNSEL